MSDVLQGVFDTVISVSSNLWVASPIALLLVFVCTKIATKLLKQVLVSITKKTKNTLDDELVIRVIQPLEMAVFVFFLSLATSSLQLDSKVLNYAWKVEKTLYAVALLWFSARLIDLVINSKIKRLGRSKSSAANVLPLVRRVLKILMFVVVGLFLLQNFGIDIGALLAGLGIGGLAIALAGQKTIENLFGGVMVVLDQPAKVGDYCKFGDQVGTVEDIGLRSTRIRTLDRTLITVPNAEFSQMTIENFGKRDRIRLHTMLGVRYETEPEQMRYLLVELRKMLLSHPKIDRESQRVRFVEFGAYSLNIEISAYIMTQLFTEFAAIREDLYLQMMELVDACGTGFAFPSQTVYIGRDTGTDEDKTKKAAKQVNQWRKEEKLYMPDVSEEEISDIDDTLIYPPRGGCVNDSIK
jgi:MscS family membrane protein